MIESCFESKDLKSLEIIISTQAALAEAVQLIKQRLDKPEKKYVHGIQGLQDLFHCSKPTALRIKRSGKIDAAIAQFERTIVIDSELAVQLLKESRSPARR
ncbi:MAG: DUF3853 family protein [Bacteroidales bacterium]|nr:DUF3853 family protein [Bacteroidales bacterium]